MGATVTVGKKVAAFSARNGQTGYVLFEETYEKNCYPHTPRWSCVGLGYLEDVMPRIFVCAAACEGGDLQGRSGQISSDGYAAGWLRELANPIEMPDVIGTISCGGEIGAAVPMSKRDQVVEALRVDGFHTQAEALHGDGFRASLHDDLDLLRTIFVKHKNELGPWRFIDRAAVLRLLCASRHSVPGYAPPTDRSYVAAIPAMFSVNSDILLVEQPGSTFRVSDASYGETGIFIRSYGLTELAHPGSFRKSFARYREAVKFAPAASEHTTILVTMAGCPESGYSREWVRKVATALGRTSTEFETTLADVRGAATSENRLMYLLSCLPHLVWNPGKGSTSVRQVSLFDEVDFV